jgi:hypothetical protein
VEDASTPSGFAVSIPEVAQLELSDGRLDPHKLHPSDGFSTTPTIVAILPDEVTDAGFAGVLSNPEQSILLTSPTLLIEARTGQLIPHFVDIDARDPKREKSILIRPLIQLKPRERYVVALHQIKNISNELANAAPGFALLRDNTSADIPALAALQETFESQVFSITDAVGVVREELQLAFTFTTRSKEAPRADMLRIRELTLQFLENNTPQVSNLTVEDIDNDPIRCQVIRGDVTGPLFLTSHDQDGTFTRDVNGQIIQNGTANFTFTAVVPRSVCDANTPGRMLAFGHGFFFRAELQMVDDANSEIAERLQTVMLGIDWFGMNFDDGVETIQLLATDPNSALRFTDRIHQGMADWMVMLRAIKVSLPSQPEFQRSNNQPLYQTESINFLGISQGHILGSVLGALSPDIDRLGLHVGGAGFTHIMSRARPFGNFLNQLSTSLFASREQQKFIAMIQEGFDRIDPATYAELLLDEPLPQSANDRRVLLQSVLGDSEVPNLGNFLHARILRLPLLAPTPQNIFGINSIEGPVDGSAMVLFDMGLDLVDIYSVPDPSTIEQNGAHEGLRFFESVHAQWDAFYRLDSQIIHTCDGICDPE